MPIESPCSQGRSTHHPCVALKEELRSELRHAAKTFCLPCRDLCSGDRPAAQLSVSFPGRRERLRRHHRHRVSRRQSRRPARREGLRLGRRIRRRHFRPRARFDSKTFLAPSRAGCPPASRLRLPRSPSGPTAPATPRRNLAFNRVLAASPWDESSTWFSLGGDLIPDEFGLLDGDPILQNDIESAQTRRNRRSMPDDFRRFCRHRRHELGAGLVHRCDESRLGNQQQHRQWLGLLLLRIRRCCRSLRFQQTSAADDRLLLEARRSRLRQRRRPGRLRFPARASGASNSMGRSPKARMAIWISIATSTSTTSASSRTCIPGEQAASRRPWRLGPACRSRATATLAAFALFGFAYLRRRISTDSDQCESQKLA